MVVYGGNNGNVEEKSALVAGRNKKALQPVGSLPAWDRFPGGTGGRKDKIA